MNVGFIGAGTVTKTFGHHLLTAGHSVVVSNSRGPETLAEFVADLGPGALAGTKQQAAECEVVILATNWVRVPDALSGIDWRGRILVDATNAHADLVPDISLAGVTRSRAALQGRTSSAMVAEMAAGARLVKSISNMPMDWIQDFSQAAYRHLHLRRRRRSKTASHRFGEQHRIGRDRSWVARQRRCDARSRCSLIRARSPLCPTASMTVCTSQRESVAPCAWSEAIGADRDRPLHRLVKLSTGTCCLEHALLC